MNGRRIRVLQVITSLAGGAGLYAYQLTRHLDPSRFDVKLVFGPGYPLDAVVERERLPHAKLSWTRRLNPLATLYGVYQLAQILRRQHFDIVHTHCSLAGAVGRVLARWFKVPHVLFSVHAFASRDYQPVWRKQLFLMLERWLDRYTDRYLASTDIGKQKIVVKRISTADRVSVVPLGIDIPPIPSNAQRLRARACLGLADNALTVATAGRFERQKGLIHLLRAFADVHAALPAARLVIFGDGPLYSTLRTETSLLGLENVVVFAGWRSDLDVLLSGCDVFCLASLWETFGYVLLEAMAARLPIVATCVDGIPEVTGDGQCALLVPPANAAALAAALIALLKDGAQRAMLAEQGRQRVVREYTLARMIGRVEGIYEELLERVSARG
ncbi:MAG: hypothetical protein A3H27_08115 [Acidobacteria bacterium RIFCSPLOWO2_02_FULL_59_13]|nr:MAG: hypothetical protein A3H27_08115 [Acidobacteria bacterium RIFCSPLOWO2_02_FULL_59_13]